MGRFWDALLNMLTGGSTETDRGGQTPASVVIGPSSRGVTIGPQGHRVTIGPMRRLLVDKVQRPQWDELEWTRTFERTQAVYVGHFRATQHRQARRFAGRIVEGRRGLEAYIADPPVEIKRHPKGPCFALVNPPWFKVHWRRPPKDVDNAILYVETILREALMG